MRKALIVMGRLYRFAKRDHIVTHNLTVDVGKPIVRSRKGVEERLTPEQLADLFDVVSRRMRVIPAPGSGCARVKSLACCGGVSIYRTAVSGYAASSRTVSLSNSQRRMRALETDRSTPSWPAYSPGGSFRCHLSVRAWGKAGRTGALASCAAGPPLRLMYAKCAATAPVFVPPPVTFTMTSGARLTVRRM